ncbi:MAG: hypothetical protein Q7T76_15860, partial [Ferruginibacter sp.]|nr:hypothetical protein [Ferruginibacter sp.]
GKVAANGPTITLQGDKILVTGSNRNNLNNKQFSLTRLTKDGNVDNSFGTNGRTILSFAPLDNNLYVNQMSGGAFYAAGSGVNKWGQNVAIISKFIVSPIQLCPPTASTSLVSNKSGTNYQWQVKTDSIFVNLSNNANYSGVTTKTLQLTNAPSSWNGYVYRCIVDGNYSSYSEITFADTWTGSISNTWENAVNWSCGVVPDANTDVIIEKGIIEINANTTIRSLQLNGSAKITVKAGVQFIILR